MSRTIDRLLVDGHGFCQHCATWGDVRYADDMVPVSLCVPCFVRYSKTLDTANAALRKVRV